ncbi:EamA family transporter [Pseudoxanthomonas winnipegensis]|uniref:EamA family transporter n=1 Tax=Pseudoxanthomonas winnipegensis TaxID=2480810 RepID=UPI00197EA18F|nr:EamA family transporter [Pseudoxanthomonas winnipegensis]
MTSHPSILAALAAALLFGASTPFAKQLAGDISPILLAGLLYLGSGIGLWVVRLIRDRGFAAPDLSAREWPWLLGSADRAYSFVSMSHHTARGKVWSVMG